MCSAGVLTRAQEGARGCRESPPIREAMLLTIKDLSRQLNIKPSTLYLWAAQGKIPCQKIHGLIRFDPEAIADWLRSFHPSQATAVPSLPRNLDLDLDRIIEAAKRPVYTPAHGETITPSPNRKEDENGAR
jgi:excisionase family DNA binding protein